MQCCIIAKNDRAVVAKNLISIILKKHFSHFEQFTKLLFMCVNPVYLRREYAYYGVYWVLTG